MVGSGEGVKKNAGKFPGKNRFLRVTFPLFFLPMFTGVAGWPFLGPNLRFLVKKTAMVKFYFWQYVVVKRFFGVAVKVGEGEVHRVKNFFTY